MMEEKRCLPGCVTSVNAEITAGHEGAGVADEKDRSATVLLRGRQSTKHVLLGPLVAALGELHEQVLDHGGHDVAGGDGVDADSVLTPFHSEIAA